MRQYISSQKEGVWRGRLPEIDGAACCTTGSPRDAIVRTALVEMRTEPMNIDEHSRRRLSAVEETYMTVDIAELPPEGMLVPGVILAGNAQRVTRTGLSLLFTAAGITVQATDPPSASLLAWSGLDGATCRERVALTDGREAAVLELLSDGQSIQFLLPADTVVPGQVAYLDQALPVWLARYRGPGMTSAPPPPAPAAPPTGPGDAGWGSGLVGGVAGAGGAAAVAASAAAGVHNGSHAGAAPPLVGAVPPPAAAAPPAWAPPPSVIASSSPAAAPAAPGPAASPEWPLASGPPPRVAGPSDPSGVAVVGSPVNWSGMPTTVPMAPPPPPPSDGFFTSGDPGPGVTGEVPAAVAPGRAAKRKAARKWQAALLMVLVLLVAVVGVVIYLLTRPSSSTTATPATIALAKSINLRITDLPSDWSQSGSTTPVPPLAPTAKLFAAQRTLATCLQLPEAQVEGWFGVGQFSGQVVQATSPTFGTLTTPTVQMSSITSVVATTADSQSLVAAVSSPNFGPCFGQFQVASAAVPATAQVQAVTLSAPPGTRSFGYVTTFTLPGAGHEVVGDAFILGGRIATLLKASTNGPVIPSADFNQAYHAVAGRVARASGQ